MPGWPTVILGTANMVPLALAEPGFLGSWVTTTFDTPYRPLATRKVAMPPTNVGWSGVLPPWPGCETSSGVKSTLSWDVSSAPAGLPLRSITFTLTSKDSVSVVTPNPVCTATPPAPVATSRPENDPMFVPPSAPGCTVSVTSAVAGMAARGTPAACADGPANPTAATMVTPPRAY